MRPHPGRRTLATQQGELLDRACAGWLLTGLNSELLPLKRPPSLGRKSRGLDFPKASTSRTSTKPLLCLWGPLRHCRRPKQSSSFPGTHSVPPCKTDAPAPPRAPSCLSNCVSISNCANRVRQTLSWAPNPYRLKFDPGLSHPSRPRGMAKGTTCYQRNIFLAMGPQ